MKRFKKGCHALIVALVMAVFCNFIAFGDEVAAPESAVESVMDDTTDASVSESADSEADEAADADSDSASEPDGSEAEETPEPEDKKDDDQSFDSGKKEDHSSFDEWDFQEPENPAPEPAPQPTPEPEPVPEPEKPEPTPEIPATPEPQPETPVVPVTPEPTPQPEPTPEPEKPVTPEPTPERWHDDNDDDDDDIVVVIPKKPVFTAETDTVPVVKTFDVSSGDTLPTPEKPVVTTEKASSSELPKTGDSSLALYAFMASAFGLVVLLASSFIGRSNADEATEAFSAYPQMCCGPQETEKTDKDVSVKAARPSGTKNAPSRFGLRCQNCIEIVLALTHPGWGLFVSKSR